MISPTDLRCEYRRDPLGVDVARPHLSWALTSRERDQRQTAYQVLVASRREDLVRNRADQWDSGRVASANSHSIVYGGRPLAPGQACWWKVRVWDGAGRPSAWSAPATWETGLLRGGAPDWGAAVWINDGKPNPKASAEYYRDDPAPLLRKPFVCEKPVARARLYVSGLGYVEPYLNGERVGNHVLDPGWTTVEKRVLYSVYDVTRQIQRGPNCLGAMLGNGFYNPLPLPFWGHLNLREHLSVGRPRLIARLEMAHSDGTKTVVVSDETWQVADGPVIRNSVYLGEVYDARRELPGWCDAMPKKGGPWRTAGRATEPLGPLVAQDQPPIRVTATLKPHRIAALRPGVFLVDFGQNFAGVVQIRVRGAAPGTAITLRSGELLYPDGTLNPLTAVAGQIKNPRGDYGGAPVPAVQQDTYLCKGSSNDQAEEWTPRFTFHGFRYVEVTGWPGTPRKEDISGQRLSADLETIGTFACSDPFLNRLDAVCRWTFLSNVFSVQSDCPHREKFGYGGDIVPTADAYFLRFDMARFYAKVATDFGTPLVRTEGRRRPRRSWASRTRGRAAGPARWAGWSPCRFCWTRCIATSATAKSLPGITMPWRVRQRSWTRAPTATSCRFVWAITRASTPSPWRFWPTVSLPADAARRQVRPLAEPRRGRRPLRRPCRGDPRRVPRQVPEARDRRFRHGFTGVPGGGLRL
jgi:alpha-L-rhamnosidase